MINVASEAPEPSGQAADLRAELASLKDMVEKHEKMLRHSPEGV